MPDDKKKIKNNPISFALYRLPGEAQPQLVVQTAGAPADKADYRLLNGQQGFVMAPFCIHHGSPLLVIRPDLTACGWSEIEAVLQQWGGLPGIPPYTPKHAAQLHQKEQEVELQKAEQQEKERQEKEAYRQRFQRFFDPLCQGRFTKLVLARCHRRSRPADFNPLTAFREACSCYPQLMVYLCSTPQSGCWMGCTPELLLKADHATEWRTVSLAGTQPVASQAVGTAPAEELVWNEKNRREQALVTRYIEEKLRPLVTSLTMEGPHTVQAGPVAHLKTAFRFTLQPSVQPGDLLQALHPTPAVCGLPCEEARCFIGMNEGFDRRYYAGFIGPYRTAGATALFVNLRCMQILDDALCLYAGGGLLPDSTWESEWEETKEKMKTIDNRIPTDVQQ